MGLHLSVRQIRPHFIGRRSLWGGVDADFVILELTDTSHTSTSELLYSGIGEGEILQV